MPNGIVTLCVLRLDTYDSEYTIPLILAALAGRSYTQYVGCKLKNDRYPFCKVIVTPACVYVMNGTLHELPLPVAPIKAKPSCENTDGLSSI